MRILVVLLLVVLGAACRPADVPDGIDAVANDYVVLALAAGRHDPDFVDAWYGPPELEERAEADTRDLAELRASAAQLREFLGTLPVPDAPLEQLRRRYLDRQLGAMVTRLGMMLGETLPFDEETALLYDAVAPLPDIERYEQALAEIEAIVPGQGPLAERVEALHRRFIIPPERLAAVFERAIAECRARTLAHIELPEHERFTIEYVTDKPWSGYNWFQGDAYSLIQINTDLPIFIGRAIDLGCHEGYPGHHAYNVLLESELARRNGWVEFTLYALFSPQSLVAEGSANYGIDIAFPEGEFYEFEEQVLMPLAGLDTAEAGRYRALREALKRLDDAGNAAARRYLDGSFSREEAVEWLVRYTLVSPERAAQRVDFFDKYRGYVINYNLGRDMVRAYIECGTDAAPERWRRFAELLGSPRLPSDLADGAAACAPPPMQGSAPANNG